MKIGIGAIRLSALIIDTHKDWMGYRIENLGAPLADTHVPRARAGDILSGIFDFARLPDLATAEFVSGVSGRNHYKDSKIPLSDIFYYIPTIVGNSVIATDNIARGITPTSNVTITNPEYATDDDYTTAASVTYATGNYIRIDLGAVYTVWLECVAGFGAGSNRSVVEISNDAVTWTIISPEKTGWHDINGEYTFRYIQARITYVIDTYPLEMKEVQCYKNYRIVSVYPARGILKPLTYATKSLLLRLPQATDYILCGSAKVRA